MLAPCWYAVSTPAPSKITLLSAKQEGPAGGEVRFGVRVLDASGLALDLKPGVDIGPGGGQLIGVESIAQEVPGAYMIALKLGPEAGPNLFRITAGPAERIIEIVAK